MKTRKINRRGKTNVPRQGSKAAAHTAMPSYSGTPSKTEAPKATMRNTSMTKPGTGTRGSGKGCR